MRKAFFLLSFCVAAICNAQTYSISPAKTVSFNAAYFNVTVYDIYMVNTGNNAITLTWEKISESAPNGWDYSMCDLGTCHPGIPQGPTTMSTVAAGGQGFLGLNVDPSNIPGNGIVKVRVYQQGFINKADTLTWYITAGPTALKETAAAASGIRVYPNPASEKIVVQRSAAGEGHLKITDVTGRLVSELDVIASSNEINVSGLNKGVYLVHFTSEGKKYTTRFIKE
jgi:hypothetical protein